jgi:ABC-2 type transport system permease protein
VHLAGARDLGAGVVPSRTPRLRLLNSPLGLGFRLARPTAIGWAVGAAALALVFGLISKSFAQATAGYSNGARQTLTTLGGQPSGPVAWLGVTFLFVAIVAALAAAGQVTSSREEEADGRLDQLLTQPVGRVTWLTGRFAGAAAPAKCRMRPGNDPLERVGDDGFYIDPMSDEAEQRRH